MRPVQPSVVAVQRYVMLSAVPSSGTVNSVIRITGIGDRDRPEWLIRINGMRSVLSTTLSVHFFDRIVAKFYTFQIGV